MLRFCSPAYIYRAMTAAANGMNNMNEPDLLSTVLSVDDLKSVYCTYITTGLSDYRAT